MRRIHLSHKCGFWKVSFNEITRENPISQRDIDNFNACIQWAMSQNARRTMSALASYAQQSEQPQEITA